MNYISPMYTLLFMRFYFKYLHGHQYTFSISHIFFCNFNTISDTFLKMIQLCKLIFNWFFITSINLKPLEIIYLQDKNKNSNWIGYWRQFENKYKINFPCLFIKWFIIFFNIKNCVIEIYIFFFFFQRNPRMSDTSSK